jgi:DtxR family Mn-dependent transcriptional regulator
MSRSNRQAVKPEDARVDLRTLASLEPGTRGHVARVTRDLTGRAERLAALGVSPGAAIRVLQTFPGIVFECDQTEMAVERAVARSIFVDVTE